MLVVLLAQDLGQTRAWLFSLRETPCGHTITTRCRVQWRAAYFGRLGKAGTVTTKEQLTSQHPAWLAQGSFTINATILETGETGRE